MGRPSLVSHQRSKEENSSREELSRRIPEYRYWTNMDLAFSIFVVVVVIFSPNPLESTTLNRYGPETPLNGYFNDMEVRSEAIAPPAPPCRNRQPNWRCSKGKRMGECRKWWWKKNCSATCRACCGDIWETTKCTENMGRCSNPGVAKKCRKTCNNC